jgi:hypothetical protein
MNKRKLFVLAILALVLLLGVLAAEGAEQQRHPTSPVTFVYTWQGTLDPGRSWVDKSGVLHIRNRVDYGLITGDIQGNATVDYNVDMMGTGLAELFDAGGPVLPPDGEAYGSMKIFSWTKQLLWSGDWRHKVGNGLVVAGEMTAFNPGRTLVMNITSVFEGEAMGVIHIGTIDHYCEDRCR